MTSLQLLIIEDDADLRQALADSFRDEGCAVVEACNGPAGIEAIRASVFDIVISDVDMPNGGARELLAEMGKRGIVTPVILITGGSDLDEASALRLGATAFLAKPFRFQMILELVEAVTEALPSVSNDLTESRPRYAKVSG